MNSISKKLLVLSLVLGAFPSLSHGKTSQQAFTELMADPYLNEAFRRTQIQHGSTDFDKDLTAYFLTDPVFAPLRPLIENFLVQSGRKASAMNLANMTEVNATNEAKYFKAVRNVMIRHGFSEAQIKNAKIFKAFGPLNAYTFGVDKNNVVVVVYDTLINEASPAELEAVIGHEMKHILNQHVLQGVLVNLMIERIARLALSRYPLDGSEDDDNKTRRVKRHRESAEEKIKRIKDVEALTDSIFQGLENNKANQMVSRYGFPEVKAKEEAQRIFMPVREAYQLMRNEIDRRSMQVGPKVLIESSQKFIQLLRKNMAALETPPELDTFLVRVSEDLPTTNRPNVEDFMNNFSVIVNSAASRSWETTADLGGVGMRGGPFYGAKFDLYTAGGVGFPKDYYELPYDQRGPVARERIRKSLDDGQDQLDAMRSQLTEEEFNNAISGTGRSHPLSMIRAINQRYYAQARGMIALRNPFLNHLILLDTIKTDMTQLTVMLNQQKEQLNQIAAFKSRLESEKVTEIMAEYKAKTGQDMNVEKMRAKVSQDLKGVQKNIDGLSEAGRGISTNKLLVEKTIVELVTKFSIWDDTSKKSVPVELNNPNPLSNPLLRNLAEFRLAEKDYLMDMYGRLETNKKQTLESGQVPKEEMKRVNDNFKTLELLLIAKINQPDEVVAQVIKILEAVAPKSVFLARLKKVESTTVTQPELRALAKEMVMESQSQKRNGRVDPNLNLTAVTSTAKSVQPFLPDKDVENSLAEIKTRTFKANSSECGIYLQSLLRPER